MGRKRETLVKTRLRGEWAKPFRRNQEMILPLLVYRTMLLRNWCHPGVRTREAK
jgi:hypothetical protein